MNPVPSPGSATEKRSYEPSMEEILASIRRIIADDQSLPGHIASARDRGPPMNAPPSDMPPNAPFHVSEPQVGSAPPSTTQDGPRSGARSPDAGSGAVAPQAVVAPEPNAFGRMSPIQWKVPEPVDETVVEPAHEAEVTYEDEPTFAAEPPPASSPRPQQPAAHGSVAAPQYAGPDPYAFADEGGDHGELPDIAADPVPSPEPPPPREIVHESIARVESMPSGIELFDAPIEPPGPQHASAPPPLFSSATDSAVSGAFNVLAASRLAANSEEIMNLVREMLRPLLRNWLDDNLPSMVERMVRDEIERVARGGR